MKQVDDETKKGVARAIAAKDGQALADVLGETLRAELPPHIHFVLLVQDTTAKPEAGTAIRSFGTPQNLFRLLGAATIEMRKRMLHS